MGEFGAADGLRLAIAARHDSAYPNRMGIRAIAVLSALACLHLCPAYAGDWPAFRGPDGTGIAREDRAPLRWGPAEHVRWKVPLPGPGNSSPIVVGGRVMLTCAEQQGRQRHLFCYDAATGDLLWTRTAEVAAAEPTHPTNPYCSSTPVADDTRVVVWHGSAGVFCFTLDGSPVWRAGTGKVRHDWGYASSPIIHRGTVILNVGPGAVSYLVALDLQSGAVRWRYDEPGGSDTTAPKMIGSWTTPFVTNVDARDQVICSMPSRMIACDAETGALAWYCTGLADEKATLVYPSPLVSNGVGVACSGWVNGPVFGFKLGGSGDITATNRIWLARQPQQIASGVAVDGSAYIVTCSPSSAQCVDMATGNVRWTEVLGPGESWGSLVRAAGRFDVTTRKGVTYVFRASPDSFELLAENDLGEPSNATPAIAGGRVYLRTDKNLYCIADD